MKVKEEATQKQMSQLSQHMMLSQKKAEKAMQEKDKEMERLIVLIKTSIATAGSEAEKSKRLQ